MNDNPNKDKSSLDNTIKGIEGEKKMENNEKIPNIRFNGFTDTWEQRKLGEIAKSYSGGTPSVSNLGYYGGNIPFIRSAEINSNITELFLTQDGLINSSAKMVNIGDILYALYGATSGEVGISRINGAINQAILVIKPKSNFDSYFIMQWLRLQKQKIRDKYLQGGQGNLSGAIIKDLEIPFPNNEEQTQIGTFFSTLDSLITLHQRKCDLLVKMKKSYLQKMFPKNGEDKPEIRFDGFTDAWEQRKLLELFIKGGSGGTPRSTNREFYKGDIPFLGISDITNSNGFIDNTEKHISEDGLRNSAAWVVPKGSISLAMYASVGKLAILNIDVATSQAFYNMVFKDYNLRDYVYQRLNKANDSSEWNKLISTGTQANLNADKVKNFEISIPVDKDEIAQVSRLFMQIDSLITLHQRECELFKSMKKSLLKQMFI